MPNSPHTVMDCDEDCRSCFNCQTCDWNCRHTAENHGDWYADNEDEPEEDDDHRDVEDAFYGGEEEVIRRYLDRHHPDRDSNSDIIDVTDD